MTRATVVGVVAIVVVAGILPWAELSTQLPWGPDAVKWIERTATDQPGWWRWAVGSRHFVGYRPVTALSFSLGHALFGYSALAYRLVDIALHAVAGGLAWVLYRQWTGDRSAAGLLVLALVYGHPAVEEVVPFVARRSYLLASVLGLSSLLCVGRSADAVDLQSRQRWAIGAALCFGAAVLSHEAAYVLLPLAPAVALHQARPTTRLGVLLAGAWVPLVAVYTVLARHQVLGVWGGGYVKRYFATVTVAGPSWRELDTWQPRRLAQACWEYLVVPHGPDGSPSWLADLGSGWVLIVTMGLSWWCVVRPILRADRASRVAALAGMWLVGGTLLVVVSQTWFWRQAAILLVPLGLVAAGAVRAGWDGLRQRRWVDVGAGALAGIALLGMLSQGPLARGGMSLEPHRARVVGTEALARLGPLLADLPARSRVYLVIATQGRTAQMVRTWATRVSEPLDLDVRVLAHATRGADRRRVGARVVARGKPEGRELVLSGPVQAATTEHVHRRGITDRGGRLGRLKSRNRAVFLVFVGDREGWRKPINGPPR